MSRPFALIKDKRDGWLAMVDRSKVLYVRYDSDAELAYIGIDGAKNEVCLYQDLKEVMQKLDIREAR